MPDDIIGADDIIGMGYDVATGDEVDAMLSGYDVATGTYGPAMARYNPAHPAAYHGLYPQLPGLGPSAQQLIALRNAHALTPRRFVKAREYTLGFSGAPVAIAAAATSVLKAQPQVPFRGRRLIIPSDVAGALIINNLIIGKNPVLVSADPVSARAYTEVGVGVDLNMDTAQISQLISLSLTNNSGASVSVTPTLIGTAME